MRGFFKAALATMLMPPALPATAAEGDRIQVTGEIIDTWCYYSGVMGGPDAIGRASSWERE